MYRALTGKYDGQVHASWQHPVRQQLSRKLRHHLLFNLHLQLRRRQYQTVPYDRWRRAPYHTTGTPKQIIIIGMHGLCDTRVSNGDVHCVVASMLLLPTRSTMSMSMPCSLRRNSELVRKSKKLFNNQLGVEIHS